MYALRKYLEGKDVDGEAIEIQIRKLAVADFDSFPDDTVVAEPRGGEDPDGEEIELGQSVPGSPVTCETPASHWQASDGESADFGSRTESGGETADEAEITERFPITPRGEAAPSAPVTPNMNLGYRTLETPQGPPVWISPWLDEVAPKSPDFQTIREQLRAEGSGDWQQPVVQDAELENVEQQDEEDSPDLNSSEEENLIVAAQTLQEPEEEVPTAGYVIAKTVQGVRRLHFIGACGKIPGVHFRSLNSVATECRQPESMTEPASGASADSAQTKSRSGSPRTRTKRAFHRQAQVRARAT